MNRTPLSPLEISIAAKIGSATFPPATASKRFARNLRDGYIKELSEKGRAFMAYVAHRFRRQYQLTEEEQAWVNDWKDRTFEDEEAIREKVIRPRRETQADRDRVKMLEYEAVYGIRRS